MTVVPLLLGFVFVSSTYVLSMAWIFNDVGIEKYLLGGLSVYRFCFICNTSHLLVYFCTLLNAIIFRGYYHSSNAIYAS